MAKLTKRKQDQMIADEKKQMMKQLEVISEDKRELAKRLIDRIAFMTITLGILEEDIKEIGPTYLFEQGAQKMIVENPSQKSYNAMINRYTTAYDKLMNLLPKEMPKEDDDGFDDFVAMRNG